jgi:hypothetical protein
MFSFEVTETFLDYNLQDNSYCIFSYERYLTFHRLHSLTWNLEFGI